jgi:UDP-glucose 4-epimerase
MIHVDDIARANLLAATAPATDVALNIGSGEETSLLRLAELLSELMAAEPIRPIHEAERTVNPVARRLADISEAAALIDFKRAIPLRDGLASLVAWWRAEKASGTQVPEWAA